MTSEQPQQQHEHAGMICALSRQRTASDGRQTCPIRRQMRMGTPAQNSVYNANDESEAASLAMEMHDTIKTMENSELAAHEQHTRCGTVSATKGNARNAAMSIRGTIPTYASGDGRFG